MDLNKYSSEYNGRIIMVDFDIDCLLKQTREEYLYSLWETHRISNDPVIIKVPYMEAGVWKKIRMTKIYLACDSEQRDLEKELRSILAPKPNFLERIYIRFHNMLRQEKITFFRNDFPIVTISDLSVI